MNSNLRRTCSVVVAIVLVLAVRRSPFGGNATAGPNRHVARDVRVQVTPINFKRGSAPYPSFSALDRTLAAARSPK